MLVVEQPERGLLGRAQEVWLVGHAAQARHHVRPTVPDAGHDVEQARAPVAQHLGALNGDVALGRDPAQTEPRLGEGAQRLVALGAHAGAGLSSGARSNHKKP